MTKPSAPLNRDKLFMMPRDEAARLAFEALHPLQNLKPEEMMAGLAVLFATVCQRVGQPADEMHALGLKVLEAPAEHHYKTNSMLQTLKDFAGLRVAGQNVTIQ